jgi:hypothetical protein
MNTYETGHWDKSKAEKEEPPPLIRTWNRIYIAIALYTCALTLVLYLLTVALNR